MSWVKKLSGNILPGLRYYKMEHRSSEIPAVVGVYFFSTME